MVPDCGVHVIVEIFTGEKVSLGRVVSVSVSKFICIFVNVTVG